MNIIGDRLRDELAGKNLSEIARALGVARNTLYNWQTSGNAPIDRFALLGAHGVDLTYVLTGVRSVTYGGDRELGTELAVMVSQYMSLSPTQQGIVRSTIDAFSLKNRVDTVGVLRQKPNPLEAA